MSNFLLPSHLSELETLELHSLVMCKILQNNYNQALIHPVFVK